METRKESRLGESAGAQSWGRRAGDADPGEQSQSRPGRRPGPLAGRGCGAARPAGATDLSGFSSGQSRRARGRRPAAPRHAEEPGTRRGQAEGCGSRDPRRPRRPPPWLCAGRLLGAGRTRALPPPGMLRGASAAFPGRRAADSRPRPGERKGGHSGGERREGGKEGARRRSAPRLARLRPAPPGPSRRQRRGARAPLRPAHRSTARPSPPTLDAGWPARVPRARFLFGTHNRCLGNKAADRATRARSPRGAPGRRVGNTLRSGRCHRRTRSLGQRGGESRGSAPQAHLGAGGGPDSLETPAPARPPPRGPGTSRRSLPSAPQSRPAHLPRPQPESIHSTRLTLPPPSFSLPLFTPHSTGLH